jgi:hypothetical protein
MPGSGVLSIQSLRPFLHRLVSLSPEVGTMQPDHLEELRLADKETLGKFQSLLDRLRHLRPSLEVQRKLLRGLLERQNDEDTPAGLR